MSHIDYAHVIDITSSERFSVASTIAFDLEDAREALTIDLDKAAISALSVNGKVIKPLYNNWFITIAAADLAPGRNTIEVADTRAYNSNGEGLHRMLVSRVGSLLLIKVPKSPRDKEQKRSKAEALRAFLTRYRGDSRNFYATNF